MYSYVSVIQQCVQRPVTEKLWEGLSCMWPVPCEYFMIQEAWTGLNVRVLFSIVCSASWLTSCGKTWAVCDQCPVNIVWYRKLELVWTLCILMWVLFSNVCSAPSLRSHGKAWAVCDQCPVNIVWYRKLELVWTPLYSWECYSALCAAPRDCEVAGRFWAVCDQRPVNLLWYRKLEVLCTFIYFMSEYYNRVSCAQRPRKHLESEGALTKKGT